MAATRGNVDFISKSNISIHPSCSHGPTLLFEKYEPSKGASRQFFACSAFRDKKLCSFFQWADSDVPQDSGSKGPEGVNSHEQLRKRFHKFRKLERKLRHVCCSCGTLLLGEETLQHRSQGHSIRHGVELQLLGKPSTLFTPLDNNKTFAQYLFSNKCVDFVLQTLRRLKFTKILCVGTPRIHESIQCQIKLGDKSLSSMLLDLDYRYGQMYPPNKYARYNMFNHHFFDAEGRVNTSAFLATGDTGSDSSSGRPVIVTDPPFGGMVEALGKSFVELSHMWHDAQADSTAPTSDDMVLPVVWFFPYFMEHRIVPLLTGMSMLDYKVDYDNHALYKNDKKQKGSPVRIFTNIPQERFVLPAEEGYWFCTICNRYSSKENRHCKECRSCTSKDGSTYVHCDVCMKCVKPSRVHCFKCGECTLKDHVCGQKQAYMQGCHICGDLGHKRRDCPKRGEEHKKSQKRKRQAEGISNFKGKKKKKS